ncbi:hypothetical protein RWE15_08380 [Virgibacillus halophilus]|uniref:SH3b domain-containing protein n=1 Tax=Tigheibacillus halophilus TaxID=361280 RepID=A0ABU5C5G0_9BACI|nr:hypothetical protein [Virgibacillus halophilus]
MKKTSIVFIATVLLLSCLVMPMATSAAVKTTKTSGAYAATASSLNVRSGPGTTYKKLGTLHKGGYRPCERKDQKRLVSIQI